MPHKQFSAIIKQKFSPVPKDTEIVKMFTDSGLLKSTGAKGGIAIIDQGLFSLVNFSMNIILARNFTREEFGLYALSIAVYFLLFRPYSALVLEPMSVLLPNENEMSMDEYLKIHLLIHFLYTLPMGLVISTGALAASLFFGWQPLVAVFFILGISLPFIMLLWYFRQTFYILNRPAVSLVGSAAYGSGMAILLLLTFFGINVSTNGILGMMGALSLIASAIMFLQFESRAIQFDKKIVFQMLKTEFKYGKWMILASGFAALATQGLTFIVSITDGVSSAGVLRAAETLVRPVEIVAVSLSAFFLPLFSRDYSENRMDRFQKKDRILKIGLMLVAAAFLIFLIIFRVPLDKFLYDGNYSDYVGLFPLYGVIAVLMSIRYGLSLRPKSGRRPQVIAYSSLAWAIGNLALGVWLIPRMGVWGVAAASIGGYVFADLTLLFAIGLKFDSIRGVA